MDELKPALKRAGLDWLSLGKFCYSAPIVFFLAVVLSGAIVTMGEAALRGYHLMQPHTYWGEYYSAEPVSDAFMWNQPIRLTSVLELRRDTDLAWSHDLYCRHGTSRQFEFFDSMVGSSFGAQSAEKTATVWQWRSQTPKTHTECYIDYTFSFIDPLTKVERRQHLSGIGDSFMVNVK